MSETSQRILHGDERDWRMLTRPYSITGSSLVSSMPLAPTLRRCEIVRSLTQHGPLADTSPSPQVVLLACEGRLHLRSSADLVHRVPSVEIGWRQGLRGIPLPFLRVPRC